MMIMYQMSKQPKYKALSEELKSIEKQRLQVV